MKFALQVNAARSGPEECEMLTNPLFDLVLSDYLISSTAMDGV